MTFNYHVISTLVEDKPGVLQKVAGMFNRRGFNIDSITVNKVGKVRRAKLYYLRNLTGKKARIAEKRAAVAAE